MTSINGYSTARDMLDALRAGHITSQDLLTLHQERRACVNPALNAIVTPNDDEARAAALDADRALAQGDARPLLGLPLTIKDCIYVEGLPATGGVPERRDAISPADARLTARVRAAGAVIMGLTNVPPYAADWQSDNPLFGRTNNPWDLARTPGGSTGGGAAAVAAGLTPLEFGGDFSGSIRIPAAFCGVYGHKPSETLAARSGHFPGPPFQNTAVAMTVQGPLARSAADLELALKVIAGPDAGEDVAWRIELPGARHDSLRDFRVAILPPVDWVPVDDEISGALQRLSRELERLGARVGVASPERLADLRHHHKHYVRILSAISNTGAPELDRRAQAEQYRARGSEFADAWADGAVASASDYLIWFGERERCRIAWRGFFREWDILLAPITLSPAFPHTTAPMNERTIEVNGQPVDYSLQSVYPGLCNFTGQPGTAFPAGLTHNGLPIGLQAIGPYLEDRTPIRFCALIAEALGAQGFGVCQHPPQFPQRSMR